MFGNKTMKRPDTMNGAHNGGSPKPTNGAPTVSLRLEEPAPASPGQNVIGKGTLIEGNVAAEGDLRLEGTIRGDVSTKTTLIVAQGSVIEGNLTAQHAEIAGRVHGTVQTTGLLTIKSTGTIDGDVITMNLNVEAGSTFTGRFQVGPAKKAEPVMI
jgi:cytoskeletal protein CcmA (bactofilin family)